MTNAQTPTTAPATESVALIRITVLVEQKKTKEGRSFNTYKAVTKNGALVDLKFRREVPGNLLPTEKSIIVVHPDNINEARNTLYPTWWVAKVEALESWTANQTANRKRVSEVFGESTEEAEA